MSIGDWFKRLFSSAPPGDEASLDEARVDAGGGGTALGADYAGSQADSVAESELDEYNPPSE